MTDSDTMPAFEATVSEETTRSAAQEMTWARLVLTSAGETHRIDNFEVVKTLGRGGMGVVYEVVDRNTGEVFALKTIETRHLELDRQAVGRFFHEIAVLNRLSHPGIVRFIQYGIAKQHGGEDLAYFVMERLNGETLYDRLKRGHLALQEALRITALVTNALIFLEEHGVLHRDIKPANLFLEDSGRVVLMDFGLALSKELTRLTKAGHVVGTMLYMAPERLCGGAEDVSADVYALGVVLYQMLVGDHPFKEDNPTEVLSATKRGAQWPPAWAEQKELVEARSLVESMLAYQRERRPAPERVVAWCRRALSSPGARDSGRTMAIYAVLLAVVVGTLAFVAGLLVGTDTPPPTSRPPAEPPTPTPVVVKKEETVPTFSEAAMAFDYGDRALREGRHGAATVALSRALALNPALADAYRRLGDAYLAEYQLDLAAKNYKIYLALRPTDPDAERIRQTVTELDAD